MDENYILHDDGCCKDLKKETSQRSSGLLCVWKCQDTYTNFWKTACGKSFNLLGDAGAEANGLKFCSYCGKKIDEQKEKN